MKKTTFDISVIEDLKEWVKNEPKLVRRVFELIEDIYKNPFEGLGKPEGLKHQYRGFWSRRISDEHRLVYQVLSDKSINVISVYGHYV